MWNKSKIKIKREYDSHQKKEVGRELQRITVCSFLKVEDIFNEGEKDNID